MKPEDKAKMIFQVNLSWNQLTLIDQACEIMLRLYMGQFPIIADLHWENIQDSKLEFVEQVGLRERIKHQLKLLRNLLDNEGVVYGNCKSPKYLDQSTLQDIHESIRYFQSWVEHPEGGYSIKFDQPMHTNRQQPLLLIDQVLHLRELDQ